MVGKSSYKDLMYQIQRFNREFDLKLAVVVTTNFITITTADLSINIFRVRHTNIEDAVDWLIRFRCVGWYYEYSDVIDLSELPLTIKANYKYVSHKLMKLWQQVKKEQSLR